MMLYNFNSLISKLDEFGFPEATSKEFRVIKRDLTKEEVERNISFKSDGVYLNIDGQNYKGYMYIKYRDLDQYELPRFHIANCKTITDAIEENTFYGRYFWHNSNVVSIENRKGNVIREIREKQSLKLCKYCKKIINLSVYSNDNFSTDDFFNLLEKREYKDPQKKMPLDIYGRPIDWTRISNAYKKIKNYTCEKCGFGGKLLKEGDESFIHTHHIVPWELANVNSENLMALCILCHYSVDAKHKSNIQSSFLFQRALEKFILKYKTELIRLNNPYFKNINIPHV